MSDLLGLKVDLSIGSIKANFDEVKRNCELLLEEYKNYSFQENNLQEAKTKRAELNKMSSLINKTRIEYEKKWLSPFNEYKEKVKLLINDINGVCEIIDNKISTFEEKEKEQKKETIKKYFEETNNTDIIIFEKIFDIKWLNKTTKIEDIRKEIDYKISKIKTDIEAIKQFGNDKYLSLVLEKYYENYDLNIAVEYKKTLLEQDKKKEEFIQKQQEDKPIIEVKQEKKELSTTQEEKRIKTFEVNITKQQLDKLNTFLIENNIEFKEILL